ncbi:M15 family metallopeptidase [Mesorhizobium sp.]|uniref:M15 family metallopeptidase n=1 Tax=Mesorhizobium sp. TaxID=1871066 RepID=UPI0025C49217|nr:M15 family metallopeptidase [Mesorhizobium sp.]
MDDAVFDDGKGSGARARAARSAVEKYVERGLQAPTDLLALAYPEGLPVPEPAMVSGGYREALNSIRDRAYLMGERYAAQQMRADREGVNMQLLGFYDAFQRQLRALGVPMFVAEFVRSEDRQDELRALGTTKAVGGSSPHQYGLAFDLVHSKLGWDLTRQQWTLIGHIGKSVAARGRMKIDWGGDWEFYDPAHWQVRGWRLLAPNAV